MPDCGGKYPVEWMHAHAARAARAYFRVSFVGMLPFLPLTKGGGPRMAN